MDDNLDTFLRQMRSIQPMPMIDRAVKYWKSTIFVQTEFTIRLPVYGWEIVGWMPREYEYRIRHYESLPVAYLRYLSKDVLAKAVIVMRLTAKPPRPITFAIEPDNAALWTSGEMPIAQPLATKTYTFEKISSVTEFTPRVYAEYLADPEWFGYYKDEFMRDAERMMYMKLNHEQRHHHSGNGKWATGCNQPLAMEQECPCREFGEPPNDGIAREHRCPVNQIDEPRYSKDARVDAIMRGHRTTLSEYQFQPIEFTDAPSYKEQQQAAMMLDMLDGYHNERGYRKNIADREYWHARTRREYLEKLEAGR